MKVRTAIPGTAPGARLTALCLGALTLVALVTVSACSGSSSTPPVPTFSPSVTISPTTTHTVTAPATSTTTSVPDTATGTPGVTSSAPATHTVTPVVTTTVTVNPVSPVPTAAPITGGGGTAGPQDVILFGLGAAAILAGAGSLAYRRWLNRDR